MTDKKFINIIKVAISLKKAEVCKDEEKQDNLLREAILLSREYEVNDYLPIIAHTNAKYTLYRLNNLLLEGIKGQNKKNIN